MILWIKLFYYVAGLTLVGTVVLATGFETSKAGVIKYSDLIAAAIRYKGGVHHGIPAFLMKMAAGLLTLIFLYSLSDLMDFVLVKDFIKDHNRNLLFTWVLTVLASSLLGPALGYLEGAWFWIYIDQARDILLSLSAFVISCFRVQWQLMIMLLPWLIITKLWNLLFDVFDFSLLLGASIVVGYCWLLYCTVMVAVERVIQRKVLYDLGCTLCSIAIAMLVINDVDNNWTAVFQ